MAKPLSELSPAYRQRIERYAAKNGTSLTESRKAARGHERSEGHGFPVHDAMHLSHPVKEVGKPVKTVKKYRGAKTPKASDVRKAVKKSKGEKITIYVQVISSEDSPGRREEGEAPTRSIDWISITDTKTNLLEEIDLLPKGASGFDLLSKIFELDRPVEAVIAWQIRDMDSEA